MRLLAISDLHVNHPGNAAGLERVGHHPEDWLIVCGDVAERPEHVSWALELLSRRFARVIWVPGNHELWSVGDDPARGVSKYLQLVRIAQGLGVHTPEDGWLRWPGDGPPVAIVPLFVLYDYSFAPDEVGPEGAVEWAREGGIRAADEVLLSPTPYPSREAWCHARLQRSEAVLATVPDDHRTVLINHWPLRRELVRIPRVPRYIPWCGTTETQDWHERYRAEVVVAGHLHVRTTDWRDGCRFEEVSLGYPRQWSAERAMDSYLREILPGPTERPEGAAGPVVHR